MYEQLILCVSEFSELYDTSLRLGEKLSWRHISIQVGMSGVFKVRWLIVGRQYASVCYVK